MRGVQLFSPAQRQRLTMEVRDVDTVQQGDRVFRELVSLLSGAWTHPDVLLQGALTRVDRVLFARSFDGSLVGFVTWRGGTHEGRDGRFAAAYIGLGAVESSFRGRGLGTRVLSDGAALAWAELTARHPRLDPWLWTITGSPIAYRGLKSLYRTSVGPGPSGEVAEAHLGVVQALRRAMGAAEPVGSGHPHVLRGVSKSRYNAATAAFHARVLAEDPIGLFQDVQESRGDRVMLLFRPPTQA